jgi:hypothetical protein
MSDLAAPLREIDASANPWHLYDWLLDSMRSEAKVRTVVIGLTWTLCRSAGWGLAMSPRAPGRALVRESPRQETVSVGGYA